MNCTQPDRHMKIPERFIVGDPVPPDPPYLGRGYLAETEIFFPEEEARRYMKVALEIAKVSRKVFTPVLPLEMRRQWVRATLEHAIQIQANHQARPVENSDVRLFLLDLFTESALIASSVAR